MSDTREYEFVGSSHQHDGEWLNSDSDTTVELTDAEYAAFAHKFEPTGDEPDVKSHDIEAQRDAENESEAEAQDTDDAKNVDTADEQGAAEFVDNNAEDVAAAIEAGDADGHLAEARDAESNDRDRKTVHNALDARADETGEDAGDRPEE